MKTLAKVFLILSSIGFGIGALIGLISSFIALPGSLALLYIVVILSIPMVINILTFRKLCVARSKREVTGYAVASLILGGFLGGLLILCMDESYFSGVNAISKVEVSKELNANTLEKDLTKLKELRDNGTLSEEEYAEARKKAIDKSVGGK